MACDSAAFQNITFDLANLYVHSEYDDTDEVVIGDGSSLQVTHVGSITFPSFSKPFKLINILCVPNIHQNLIYVHNFTRSNNVFINFHPFYFLVKDQSTGATLFCDKCHEGVYPIPMTFSSIKSFVLALVGERTIFIIWHRWFGHPLNKIIDLIIHHFLFQL